MDNDAPVEAGRPRTHEPSSRASGGDIRTFLIADLRGYTSFTREQGDDAAAALAASFALLTRSAVADYEGEVIELRGDEALAVFSSARQALRAAVEIQRRARSDAESVFPLGIGIGLDAGEAVPLEGGYRGGALNLASRLCSLAAPGQILVSETVVGLAGRLDGMQLVKRRSVRLKGLEKSTPVTEAIPDPPLPPIPAAEPSSRSFFRRRTLLVLAVAILVAGLVAFLVLSRGNSDERDNRSPAAPIRANSVLVLDASTGRRLADLPLTSTPGPVTYGQGAVWVGTPDEHTVSTIDPQTLKVTPFGVGLEPSGLAVGEGALWVAGFARSKRDFNREEDLLRIQPGSHEVTSTLRIARRSQGFAIAVAAGLGSAWVGYRTELALAQVDSGGRRVSAEIPDVDPAGIALLDGSVWVADYSGSAVARIDPSTRTVTPIPMGFPIASIASGDGAIWVGAGQTARDQVWQILPSSNSVRRSLGVGPGVGSIAAGDGSIWVASSGFGLSPSISRIDTQTFKVTTAMIPRPPQGIAVGAGRVWVTLR